MPIDALYTSTAQPSGIVSLPEALAQALRRHPDVRSAQALLQAQRERVLQAGSNYYPTLGVEAVAGDTTDLDAGQRRERSTRRADLTLRWNLFRGQGDRYAERGATYEELAAAAELESVREQVALQVVQSYLDVLRLRLSQQIGTEHLVDVQRLVEDVRKRVDVGRAPQADLEQAQAILIQAKAQQALLRGRLKAAEERYRLIVGLPPGELLEPVLDDVLGQGFDQLMQQALSGNARVQAAVHRAAARGEEVGVAAAALYPSLDLELRRRLHSEIEPAPPTVVRDATQLQLSYQMPLGGASLSRRREAVERKAAARAAADTEFLRIQTELAEHWAAWQAARGIAAALAERVEASGRVVRAYDLQFVAARRSMIDLITVRDEMRRARIDVVENRFEQLLLQARALSLIGRLRQSLGSEL